MYRPMDANKRKRTGDDPLALDSLYARSRSVRGDTDKLVSAEQALGRPADSFPVRSFAESSASYSSGHSSIEGMLELRTSPGIAVTPPLGPGLPGDNLAFNFLPSFVVDPTTSSPIDTQYVMFVTGLAGILTRISPQTTRRLGYVLQEYCKRKYDTVAAVVVLLDHHTLAP